MPPRRRSPPNPYRCVYREGGKRCVRNGTGEPVLCARHHELVARQYSGSPYAGSAADVIGRVSRGEKVSTGDVVAGIFDMFGQVFGGGGQRQHPNQPAPWDLPPWDTGASQGIPPRARAQPRPPPPPNPELERKKAVAAAKKTLGFKVGDNPDATTLKAKYRALARRHHPDRGGSLERMKAINAAYELLSQA